MPESAHGAGITAPLKRRASVDFDHSEKVQELRTRLEGFMDEFVYPNERTYREQHEAAENRWTSPPIMEDLKKGARTAGVWDLFLPDSDLGGGRSQLEDPPLFVHYGPSPPHPRGFQ